MLDEHWIQERLINLSVLEWSRVIGIWLLLNTSIRRRQRHPLQYSCLANPMGGGAWEAAVHGVTRSPT